MKRAIVLLIALTAWLHPIKAVSAQVQSVDNFSAATQTEVVNQVVNQEVKEPNNVTETPKTPSDNQKAASIRVLDIASRSNRREPISASYSGRHYSREEVQALIISYSEQYGINPEIPLCIAKLESGYNPLAKNRSSTASGVFQYLASTWRGTDEGKAGLSVFDAEANIQAAIKYMASRRSTKP